jgi:tetratricopeptide (TPR) repeat protein
MERKAHKLILFLLITFTFLEVKANYKSEIYRCYIYGDMVKWKQIIDVMEKSKSSKPEVLIELLDYEYGYIAWCIGTKNDDEAEKYLDFADKNVELLENMQYNLSMVNGYKAAFYGYKIGLNNITVTVYGSKSYKCAKKSIELNAKNPFGYVQFGNVQFYMPAAFGGSKQEAIDNYRKAESLMELDKMNIKTDWNYINLLITIANSYSEVEQLDKAKLYYEKILKLEPNCQWVKNDLYPQLMKQIEK